MKKILMLSLLLFIGTVSCKTETIVEHLSHETYVLQNRSGKALSIHAVIDREKESGERISIPIEIGDGADFVRKYTYSDGRRGMPFCFKTDEPLSVYADGELLRVYEGKTDSQEKEDPRNIFSYYREESGHDVRYTYVFTVKNTTPKE